MTKGRREYFRRTRKVRMRELHYSTPGWIGLCCNLGAVILFLAAVTVSYRRAGDALFYVGTVGLFALVLSLGGMVLGIVGVREEDVRPMPPRIDIVIGVGMSALLAGLYFYGL